MRSSLALALVASAVTLGGCPSFSTLQLPRTVPQNEVRFAAGIEWVGIPNVTYDPTTMTYRPLTVPQFELGVRYGLNDFMDIGVKLYIAGIEAGVKIQPIRGPFDLSIAPAFSYIQFSSDGNSVGVLHVHLPILMGVNFGDRFTIAFGPKLLYWAGFGAGGTGGISSIDGLFGGFFVSLPIRVGRAFWLAPEINVYGNLARPSVPGDPLFQTVIWQGGLGMYFGGAEPGAQPQQMQPSF